MLHVIVSLLFEYLVNPFELLQCSKSLYGKKYPINIKTYKNIDPRLYRLYKLKRLICTNNTLQLEDRNLAQLPRLDMLRIDDSHKGRTYVDRFFTDEIIIREHQYELNKITNDGIAKLPRLRYLSLRHNNLISDYGIQKLPNLRFLELGSDPRLFNNRITINIISYLPYLRVLKLDADTKMTNNDLVHLSNLWILSLANNSHIDVGVQYLTQVKSLTLQRNILFNDDIVALLPSTLQKLYIKGFDKDYNYNLYSVITDAGLIAMYNNGIRLQELEIGAYSLSDNGLYYLKDIVVIRLHGSIYISYNGLGHLKKLYELRLFNTGHYYSYKFTDEGTKSISGVKILEMNHSNISNDGLINLAGIQVLILHRNFPGKISDFGLKYLSGVKILDIYSEENFGPYITKSKTNCMTISDKGLASINSVTHLRLENCRSEEITIAGIAQLKNAVSIILPDIELSKDGINYMKKKMKQCKKFKFTNYETYYNHHTKQIEVNIKYIPKI